MERGRRDFIALGALALGASAIGASGVKAQPIRPDGSVIVVVRHADKRSGSGDVELSEAGATRAIALVQALKKMQVTTIVTTTALRSRQTAAPLATFLAIDPIEIERGEGEEEAVKDAVANNLPGVVLVVGHSETLPTYLEAFGGVDVLQDLEVDFGKYDNFFAFVYARETTHLLHTRYGTAS
jgi:phosphohistidine phosphatase SixA